MAPVSTLRSAVVQFEAVPDRPDRNLETVARLARQAVADGAQLVVFAEMCLLGYWQHRKLHAFEHEAISSGSRFTVFDTPWQVRVGVLICWDNNLVENVRATALLGATVLLAPHQTGGTNSRSPYGMKPIPLSVWANRVVDPAAVEAAFNGPNGRIIAERPAPAEAVVVADLELELVPLATGRRWLRGRRPELYGILTESQGNELDPRAARFSPNPVDW